MNNEEPDTILTKRGFKVDVSLRLLASNANLRKFDVLYLTPFHLAILAKQAEVVHFMLRYVLDSSVDPPELMRKILSKTTKVDFVSGAPEEYFEDDVMLDGINAIHLGIVLYKILKKSIFHYRGSSIIGMTRSKKSSPIIQVVLSQA